MPSAGTLKSIEFIGFYEIWVNQKLVKNGKCMILHKT
jgi:hypothetical protein